MSYTVDADGKVTFRCQGKDCGKTKAARSTKVLPKKWCITGILLNAADPESGGGEVDHARALEANNNLSGHFCSFKCARNTFADERVVAMVKKLKVCVVVYGDCKLVIDAEDNGRGDGDDDGGEERPGPGGASPKGLDRPNSPPEFQMPESSHPGF